MNTFLMSAVALGMLSGNVIDPKTASDLGIVLHTEEIGVSYTDRPPPALFTLNLEQFSSCEVSSVWIDILDGEGHVIFGSNIDSIEGNYRYYLEPRFTETSSIAIGCDAGDGNPDNVYFLNLGEYIHSP